MDHRVYLDTMFYIYKKTKLIPVLVGSKEDLPIIQNLIINKPKELHIRNLVGKTNLKDLIQIVKNAKFVISNDNGIHHLSNYLNVKTLTFFTFSSYVTLKWNNNNSFFIFNKKYQCMPCIGNKSGPFDNYPFSCPWQIRCKDSITVDNITKMMNYDLFEFEKYCTKCMDIIPKRPKMRRDEIAGRIANEINLLDVMA